MLAIATWGEGIKLARSIVEIFLLSPSEYMVSTLFWANAIA